MSSKFFQSFETKHLVISICCAIAGWGGSQLYTLGIDQAALKAYQQGQEKQLAELSTLPPEVAILKQSIITLDCNNKTLSELVNNHSYMISDNTTKITVLEALSEGVKHE